MKYIELTKGQRAIIDDKDFSRCSKYKWFCLGGSRSRFYAARNIRGKIRRQDVLLLHRFILKLSDSSRVDHINGDTLDNRRENLRICSQKDNSRNRRANFSSKTGLKGLSVMKSGKWRVHIGVNYKRIHLGYFSNISDAAEAYNIAAKKYFGEFANLNII